MRCYTHRHHHADRRRDISSFGRLETLPCHGESIMRAIFSSRISLSTASDSARFSLLSLRDKVARRACACAGKIPGFNKAN
jgi:hypothetical protein